MASEKEVDSGSHDLCPKPPPTFVREATGLVRSMSAWNAFIVSTIITNYGIGLALTFGSIPAVLPGANIALAFLLVIPFVLIGGLLYVWFTEIMPRSGGDYVWISRSLFPWLAVGLGFLLVFFVAFLYGSIVNYMISFILSIGIGSLGLSLGQPALVSASSFFATTPAIISLGTLVIVISLVLCIIPLRQYLKFQAAAWILGIVSIIIFLGTYATTNNTAFVHTFDDAFGSYGTTYASIISTANTAGFSNPGLTSFALPTALAIPFAFFVLYGYQWGGYLGGELRNARKSMYYSAILGGIASSCVLAASGFFAQGSIGATFMNAMSYVQSSAPSSYTAPVPFNVFLFPIFMLHNGVLGALLIAGLFSWGLIIMSAGGLTLSRIMLGWGFDRSLPAKLSYVSDRFHTPVIAVSVYVVLLELGLLSSVYFGIIFSIINLVIVETVLMTCVSLAALVLPFRRKEMFSASPLAKSKIGGVPTISILGGIGTVLYLLLTVFAFEYPSLSGPTGTTAIGLLVGVFLIGVITFYVTKAYYKSKGLPIDMAFREIPPE